jgi:hypothetical protein
VLPSFSVGVIFPSSLEGGPRRFFFSLLEEGSREVTQYLLVANKKLHNQFFLSPLQYFEELLLHKILKMYTQNFLVSVDDTNHTHLY